METLSHPFIWNQISIGDKDLRPVFTDIVESKHPFLEKFHGYGGGLMLKGDALGISSVLVSDMHRHEHHGNPMNGVLVLTPLVNAGICNFNEIDNLQGRRIILSSGNLNKPKSDPFIWNRAINLLLTQRVNDV